jgi:hypothetical protein
MMIGGDGMAIEDVCEKFATPKYEKRIVFHIKRSFSLFLPENSLFHNLAAFMSFRIFSFFQTIIKLKTPKNG